MLSVYEFLPSGEGGDEKGGLKDLAGGNGMCGRGLREVVSRRRDCEVMKVKDALNYTRRKTHTSNEALKEQM